MGFSVVSQFEKFNFFFPHSPLFRLTFYQVLRNTAISGTLSAMDKLDKLPPKNLTPLKSSIAQGVISNTIFTVAWNGASAVIGLLTRHYALIYGIPPFLAIFLGVIAFFLMALSINLMRRKKDAKALSEIVKEDAGKVHEANKNTFSCDETWLHQIAKFQEESIHVAIRVLDCTLLYKDLESAAPLVNFNFHILNASVHSVAVEKNIDGWVDFAGRRLGGHLRRTDSYGPLGQGQSGYFVITQWLSKEELAMIMSSDSQCMYSFENLEVGVRGDERFPEDRKVTPQRLEIRCRIQRIGQGVLGHDPENNTQWLTEIAEDQAKTIFRFVHLTNVGFGKHELLRGHPYMEFVFNVDNRSLYDISFDDLSGAVGFAGRELTEQPTWRDRLAITHHNAGSVTVREGLTKGDVTKILNGLPSDKFDFAGLTIKVNGNHDLQSTPLHVHHLEITNDLLLAVYPKLEIEITSAKFDWVDYTRIGAHPRPFDEPCFVTLFLTVRNQRRASIAVEVFKLILEIEGKEYMSFAEDTVFEYRSVDALGGELGQGSHPNNLNTNTPLMLIEDKAVEGSLQFMFKDLRYIESLTNGIEVKNARFTLLLIDKDQERHTAQGFLPAEGFRYINNLSRNTKKTQGFG
jgi:hypothetical protein